MQVYCIYCHAPLHYLGMISRTVAWFFCPGCGINYKGDDPGIGPLSYEEMFRKP